MEIKLVEIEDILLKEPKPEKISKEKIIAGMGSEDIEVKGAIYTLISNKQFSEVIVPALTFEDYFYFLIDYFERCILTSPNGDWSDSKYSAAWDFSNWIRHWFDIEVDKKYLLLVGSTLERLHRNADTAICIETGILEHIFNDKNILRFFLKDATSEYFRKIDLNLILLKI